MARRMAILQSNYIPWKGYFDLIGSVDEFVIYDEVQFTKNDWRNRNRIKTPAGPAWLSIPVGQRIDRRICDVTISDPGWQRKHWLSLEMNYRRSRYFEQISESIRPLYLDRTYARLSDVNLTFIRAICKLLSIETRITWSASYATAAGRSCRLAEICALAGCDTYVSGPSARAYLETAEFEQRGLKVEWFRYGPYPRYAQLWGDFVHEVSVLDALFNCGPETPRHIRSEPE